MKAFQVEPYAQTGSIRHRDAPAEIRGLVASQSFQTGTDAPCTPTRPIGSGAPGRRSRCPADRPPLVAKSRAADGGVGRHAVGRPGSLRPARDPDVVAQIRDRLNPASSYCGLDCSGSPAAHRLLVEAAPPLGRVAFVGECEAATPIRVSPDLIRTGLTVMGSWHYNLNDIGRLFRSIGEADAHRIVTHVYGFDEVQKAFETSVGQRCGKVLLVAKDG